MKKTDIEDMDSQTKSSLMKKQLSKNFNLSEFVDCEIARKNNIENIPSEEIIENIQLLVDTILQPLRDRISFPFRIKSGYRCEELNTIMGGSSTSQHLQGLAADVDLESKQLNRILWEEIRNRGKFNYDQVINKKDFSWIHIGIKKDNIGNRQSMFEKN